MVPHLVKYLPVFQDHRPLAVLLVLAESPLVPFGILRNKCSLTIEHIVDEVADVAVASVCEEVTEAFSLIFSPETHVKVLVAVVALAVAMALIIPPLALIFVIFLFVKGDKAADSVLHIFLDDLALVRVAIVICDKSFFALSFLDLFQAPGCALLQIVQKFLADCVISLVLEIIHH